MRQRRLSHLNPMQRVAGMWNQQTCPTAQQSSIDAVEAFPTGFILWACNNSMVITLSSFLKWELITPDTIHRTNLYIGVWRVRVKLYLQLFSDATNLCRLHKKWYLYIYVCAASNKEKENKHSAALWTRQESKHPTVLRNENEFKMSRHRPDRATTASAAILLKRIGQAIMAEQFIQASLAISQPFSKLGL